MKSLHSRAKITKIEKNRIYYGMPQTIYGMDVTGLDKPRIFDPANLKRDFLLVSKATYLGNKNRIKDWIVKAVPDEVKTVFDPMCGTSAVLRELGEQGRTIQGNELNPIAFHISKALFLAKKPSEEECKDFIESVDLRDGHFVANNFWPAIKIPKDYCRYVDGFLDQAKNSVHPAFYTGVMSGFLTSIIGSFQGPYDPDRASSGFQLKVAKKQLLREAKQFLKCEVIGKITNYDAFAVNVPSVDLIYFDPPYVFGDPSYFKKYSKIASILLQKDWDIPPEPKQEQLAEFARKLSRHTDILMVSSSSACPLSWGKELTDPRRNISKKYLKLKGTAFNTNPKEHRNEMRGEHLWISAKKSLVDIAKAQDPFMVYPSEDRTHDYSLRIHFGGKSVHGDLLMEGLSKQLVLGYTLMIGQAGKIKEPILTIQDAKKVIADSPEYFKINLQTSDWAQRQNKNISLVATQKTPESASLLNFQGVVKPGGPGATKQYPAVYVMADKGEIEYLAQRSDFHEYFTDGKVFQRGRYVFRQLKAWSKKMDDGKTAPEDFLDEEALRCLIGSFDDVTRGFYQTEEFPEEEIVKQIQRFAYNAVYEEESLCEGFQQKAFVLPSGKEGGIGPNLGWLCIKPIDQIPYCLSTRAISKKWLPPKFFSALPKHWKKHVHDEEKYWEMDGTKALDARKMLWDRFKKEGILGKAAKGEVDPFGADSMKKDEDVEKARHSRERCMECSKPPEIEVLWAEGMAHAWFCEKHLKEWMKKEPGWHDIDSAKRIKDGKASKKFSENSNPNIQSELKALTPSGVDSLIPQQKPTREERKKKKKKDDEDEQKSIKKADPLTDFRLTYQWWKGSEEPSKYHYHIWFRTEGKKVLDFFVDNDILSSDSSGGILYQDRSGQDFEADGYIKPGTKLNPTKATPAFMKILDRGDAVLLIDGEDTKRIRFAGSRLKGTFLFTNVNDFWEIKRVKG